MTKATQHKNEEIQSGRLLRQADLQQILHHQFKIEVKEVELPTGALLR